jgi:hypothetical protein
VLTTNIRKNLLEANKEVGLKINRQRNRSCLVIRTKGRTTYNTKTGSRFFENVEIFKCALTHRP